MRIRRYWIGYRPDDVKRAERALIAQRTFLKHRLMTIEEHLQTELKQTAARIAELTRERERLLKEESEHETS